VPIFLPAVLTCGREKQDHHSNHHLEELRPRDEKGKRRVNSDGLQSVIAVHHRMDADVHTGKPNPSCVGPVGKVDAVPAVKERQNVVEPVQKDDGLLAKNQKYGISPLQSLG